MEPNVSLGLFDGLKLLGFDWSKMDIAKVDGGQAMILDGIEPVFQTPGNVDKWAFDALKVVFHNWLVDLGVKPPGPLVVGAKKPKHTREEVEAAIVAEGGDPKKFAPWLLLLLQFAPMLLDIIKKLLGK